MAPLPAHGREHPTIRASAARKVVKARAVKAAEDAVA
jgi:hypothetical protein